MKMAFPFGTNGKVDLVDRMFGSSCRIDRSNRRSAARREIFVLLRPTGTDVPINATHLTRTSLNMRGSMGSCRGRLYVSYEIDGHGSFSVRTLYGLLQF